MENDDYRVIIQDLPTTVRAFVYYDSNYCPVIVINARLPVEEQMKAYAHEQKHIRSGEMDDMNFREYGYGEG